MRRKSERNNSNQADMISIEHDILHLQKQGLLSELLQDHTTKRNIIWASNAYENLGEGFHKEQEIRPELITGLYSGVIKTRCEKDSFAQGDRTRAHGEVFTPVWICRKMNDAVDEDWFGGKDIFSSEDKIEFPEGKSWKKYVDSRRLEITCGEGPFLVSRYDAATGEETPIHDRIGILDRKLRVVNENAVSDAEWSKWAIRAVEATYGYEFQGDNLLIARINIFMTFAEYLDAQWQRKPTEQEYKKLTRVITWNLWQMNGLTGKVPYAEGEEYHQMDLFEMMDGIKNVRLPEECRIYDWRANESLTYNSMKRGSK